MSLARAFTKRMRGATNEMPAQRSNTVKHAAGSIRRDMISLPTELISTTNVQALNAPDISTLQKSNSSATSLGSLPSLGDSDFSSIDKSFLSDHDRTDSSSIEMSSPATPVTPPMNTSDGFFGAKQATPSPVVIADVIPDAPAVPKRAPSHSKKAHVELAHKRSVSRMSPPPTTLDKPARTSADFFGPAEESANQPFARELAKVNEVAEEFSVAALSFMDEEEQEIISKGFYKFTVEDYINEIAGLYGGGVFEDQLGPIANPYV